jgi:hypothetical protein
MYKVKTLEQMMDWALTLDMPEKEGGGRGKSEKKEEDKDKDDDGKSEPWAILLLEVEAIKTVRK